MIRLTLYCLFSVGLGATAVTASADMERLGDDDMAAVSGQGGGMSLSGDLTFNEDGGPLTGENLGFDDCDAGGRCGARVAAQLSEDGGWFVLDDIRGTFAFDGLTLRTRTIDGSGGGFGGDGSEFNREVLEIGMPDTARFENFSYTIATSSTARPSDTDFQQTDRMTVEMDGEVTLDGNMLVFPLDR